MKIEKKLSVAAFFAGCGGLDLGFRQAGFVIPWANEYDKMAWTTYEKNHPGTKLDRRSLLDIPLKEIPDVDGFIGGPPCQSWSLAGKMKGSGDPRGKLFFEYANIIGEKQPMFFLAENVKGIISKKHAKEFSSIKDIFSEKGYVVSHKLLNAKWFGTPQDRERVFVIGVRKDLANTPIPFPEPQRLEGDSLFGHSTPTSYTTLKDAIGDLPESMPAIDGKRNPETLFLNHEHQTGSFSYIYMSRNRIRTWDDVSFTIQASGRHAPLHPSSPPMQKVGKDKREFVEGSGNPRRLSVRECARIQDFPDNFEFLYNKVDDGYKMIGNAVPVKMATAIAESIKRFISNRISAQINA